MKFIIAPTLRLMGTYWIISDFRSNGGSKALLLICCYRKTSFLFVPRIADEHMPTTAKNPRMADPV